MTGCTLPLDFAKAHLAEAGNEMDIEDVVIMLLGCVLQSWENNRHPIVFDMKLPNVRMDCGRAFRC